MRKVKALALSVLLLAWTASTFGAGNLVPAPQVDPAGPALQFDFPGLRIGVGEYDEGPTGTTVFHFEKPVRAVVDVRGGSPGTSNTDALRLSYETPFVDAIVFAGGSSYGLSAATGVAEALKRASSDPGTWGQIATVAGAIIFDLGGRRFNAVTPDAALGAAALAAARPGHFPLGGRGAGRFATQGGYFDERHNSGQGAAFRQLGATRIAVFTVVNALGFVVDRDGRVVRCRRAPDSTCGTIAERLARRTSELAAAAAAPTATVPRGNTTLTLVLTNQKLDVWALQRLAVQVHASMARAIQPFSTENDGDVLFAATTGEVDNPALREVDLGVVASEVAWDAVLASVPENIAAPVLASDGEPIANVGDLAGSYEFEPGVLATVRVENNVLSMIGPKRENLYVPAVSTALRAVAGSADDFVLDTPRGDVVRFLREKDGRIRGLDINPGPWAIPALRR